MLRDYILIYILFFIKMFYMVSELKNELNKRGREIERLNRKVLKEKRKRIESDLAHAQQVLVPVGSILNYNL